MKFFRYDIHTAVFLFFDITFISSLTRGTVYPQRASGQAVVTGVIPPTPMSSTDTWRSFYIYFVKAYVTQRFPIQPFLPPSSSDLSSSVVYSLYAALNKWPSR